jgi:glycerol uptake facilitator protein
MRVRREIVGETLGTFLLVLLGCGSVAGAVLFQAHQGILPVALVWGIGVTLAIYLTRHLSCAHLNPAVTLAMAASGRMAWRKVSVYIVSQFFGAFLLVLMIFALTEGCNVGRPNDALAPVFIGLTVTSVICLIAPLTQAGLNPARDLGPRLVAWLMGWGDAAFPDRVGGFFHVYVLAPIVGAVAAARFFVRVLEPAMRDTPERCGCKDGTCI